LSWSSQTKEDLEILAPVAISFAILAAAAVLGWIASRLEVGLLLGVVLGPLIGPIAGKTVKIGAVLTSEVQSLYLEGKMKRYSLLFSVNGGSFAIAKLLREPKPPKGLSMEGLAVGAVVFTVLMTADIWLWGAGMRHAHGEKLFRPVGQTILLMIGALLGSAWVPLKKGATLT
jgi:hypothetical protein